MSIPRQWIVSVVAMAMAMALALAPAGARGHGDEPAGVEEGEEAEIAMLAKQPARTLAQQAHALLHIRADAHEAGVRLDAALESKDTELVDMAVLRRAAETLDGGDPAAAQNLIDTALSRPLGAESGRLFHGAGREFRSATSAQEVVGLAVGAIMLVLGGLILVRARRSPALHP